MCSLQSHKQHIFLRVRPIHVMSTCEREEAYYNTLTQHKEGHSCYVQIIFERISDMCIPPGLSSTKCYVGGALPCIDCVGVGVDREERYEHFPSSLRSDFQTLLLA